MEIVGARSTQQHEGTPHVEALPAAIARRRAAPRTHSAVSGAWQAIRADLDATGTIQLDIEDAAASGAYRLRIACDRETRERAYRLAHRVYARHGYVSPDENGMCLSRYDLEPHTLTLLVEDAHGNDVATVSLVFDSPAGLPCDEIYKPELNALRGQHHRLVEVTRLAMEGEHARSKLLLLRIFNFIYIFARRVRGYSDFVIEVNPHHVGYYRRLLAFQEIGPERACPRVHGAPAVLLRLNLVQAESQIDCLRHSAIQPNASRVLYSFVYNAEDESALAEFLARQHRPMTAEEAIYFKLVTPVGV